MTILESLKFNAQKLKDYSATPRLDAEALLCFVLEKEKEFLFTYPKTKLNTTQSRRINIAIKKRIKGMPIAHIIGRKEFFGYDFYVNENVLVPRPETEMMVEAALQELRITNYELRIVDVGTGSGCIPITIASEVKKITNKNLQITAIDISSKALYVARQNAKTYNLSDKITFREGNLLKPVIRNCELTTDKIPEQKLLITANLPYLTEEQVENSPTIKQEPILALVAGNDGLKYYRELFNQIRAMGTDMKYVILCEIDASQTDGMRKLVEEKLGTVSIEVKKDLAGLDRLVVIKNQFISTL